MTVEREREKKLKRKMISCGLRLILNSMAYTHHRDCYHKLLPVTYYRCMNILYIYIHN